MNRNFTCILLLLIFLAFRVQAQPAFLNIDPSSKVPERGLVLQAGGGLAAINSDICRTPDCNRMGPNISLGALYKLNPNFAISTELDYLRLGATDDHPSRFRNAPDVKLGFRSDVIELSGAVVYNLRDSYSGSGDYRSAQKRFMVPFVKAGVGLLYYTATSDTGNFGQPDVADENRPTYPAMALVIPVGGGLRFRFSDKISIAPELIYHISTTDYLDNIGPGATGNDRYSTDHYGVAAIKVLYTPPLKNRIFSKFR